MTKERPQTEQLIFAHRPSGKVFMRCIRMAAFASETVRALQDELEGFIDKCHADFICFVAAMDGAQTGRPAWNEDNQEPVKIVAVASDGTKRAIQTSVSPKEAADLFSTEGQFEKLQSKALVTAIFTLWEGVTRPTIASLLNLESSRVVRSELMHQWRLLRNWLVHVGHSGVEKQYFERAGEMVALLGSQRGRPEITAVGVIKLMGKVRSLAIMVNPDDEEPLLEFPEDGPKPKLGPGERAIPLWHQGI